MKTEMSEKEFNLLYEPWIIVKMKDNELKKWSILDVFKHAQEAEQLAGEIPTQDMAVMRLLLAIMHATFVNSNVETPDDALVLWKGLWDMKQFPYDIIEQYLKAYEERFWLFHPQMPFYQIADIEDVMRAYKVNKGKKVNNEEKLKTVARLIGDLFQSDHAPRLFSGRSGEQQCVLSYDEAARWLLHLNGFDDDSAKNPTPKGVGYLGQLGLIYVKGTNLFETLMLNFILLDNNEALFEDHEGARAYWEKPVCTIVENLISQPNAQKDLLTMQSRRILLKRQDNVVCGYLLTMGDYFDKEQGLLNEQMTVWKRDENKGFVPKRHMPEKQMWRDFSSLINSASINNDIRESGVVHWIKKLQTESVLSGSIITMCTVGIYYKPKGAGWQIVDFVNDSLRLNAGILGTMGQEWVDAIVNVLSIIDSAMLYLGRLSSNLATAEGDNSEDGKTTKKGLRSSARENGYHQLDVSFRKWLISINPEKDSLEDKISEWQQMAKTIILKEGGKMMDQCSDKALVGYLKKEKETVKNVNAFNFYNQFLVNVNKVLG